MFKKKKKKENDEKGDEGEFEDECIKEKNEYREKNGVKKLKIKKKLWK